MNFISCKIRFPSRFIEETDTSMTFNALATEFFSRYMVDLSSGIHSIDGVSVTLTPAEQNPHMVAVFPDNDHPLTLCRRASAREGSMPMEPIRDELGNLVAVDLWGCWSNDLVGDINREPQPEPETFGEIEVL